MAVSKVLSVLVLGLAILSHSAQAARTLYPEPFARDTKVEIPKLEAPFTLDGRLDEWKGVPSTFLAGPFQLAFGEKKWEGREDLAAELRLAWNDDSILIAIKVFDSALKNPHLGTPAVWQGDCVEIFVDGRNRKTRDANKYSKGVYQVFAAPALKEGGKADVHAGALPKGMHAASSLFGGGYILEVAIPFANLPGVEAKAGRVFSLDIAVDDNDDGRERKQQLIWAGTVNNWATPAGFATVTLVEKISDAGRADFLASGLAVEFRLSPKPSGEVIAEVAVPSGVGDWIAGLDIALLDTKGKELYVARNKPLKARRGALVAGATLKIRDLNSGNYAFAVSYKDSGGKVMAKVKRPVQWREKGRGRISGKFWSRVKRGEVKKAATIFTPELLATARRNIKKYPWAKAMRDKTVERAEPILKIPVESFLDLMPSPNMVRKYDKVCPHCGHTSMGTAPVVGILHAPWKARCIICGKSLPGFDAKRWFLSGKDERGWFDLGKADNSLLPKDPKFRETAILAMQNYCSAYWPNFRHVVNNLRLAYAFTGDERYGRYAMVLLGRFADFYPYFSADDIRDDTHPGALMQDTSECTFLQDLALAYDTCFSLVADAEVLDAVSKYRQRWGLPRFKDGVALQQHIEGNIFGIPPEERGDRMDVAGKVNKNVMVRIVNTNASRGHVAPQTIAQVFKGTPIGEAYDEEARKLAFEGFNEDGSNIEGSMEYDLWGFWYIVNHHREIMRLVPDAPGNVWKDKTVLAAYEHYFDLYCLGRYFPHFGDTWGRAAPAAMSRASYIGPNPNRYVREKNKEVANHYAQVFAATGIERFALIAQYLNGGTTDGLRMSIYDADPEAIQEKVRAVV
ncbi:MAG: sugar-binding protein [Planctomycetia bacterium]|nr:sugar-binding protein [Planctomycetia bacterium]